MTTSYSDKPISSWDDYRSKMLQPINIRRSCVNLCDYEKNMDLYKESVLASDNSTPATGESSVWYISKDRSNNPPPAQPLPQGLLDASFGTNGFNTNTISTNDSIISTAIQSDGKIVAGGSSEVSGHNGFVVARYNSNGSLDTSFGTNGFNTDTLGTNDTIYSIALQSDGKIVAGGYATVSGARVFAVARYNPNGSLDNSFGTNGFSTNVYGTTASIASIVLQSDGKIVAGGLSCISGINGPAIVRYNSNGSLDTSFGSSGLYFDNSNIFGGGITSIAIQSDGKIIASPSGQSKFNVARYNSDGSLDTSFGTNGVSSVTDGTWDGIYSIALQSDGKIVAGGFTNGSVFAVARFNSNGSLDTTFGTNGLNTDTPGIYDRIIFIAIQSDGKTVAGGYATDANYATGFGVARYNSNGSLDTSFGTNGFNTSTPGTSDNIFSIALQLDGKIVAGGSTNASGHPGFVVTRYTK